MVIAIQLANADESLSRVLMNDGFLVGFKTKGSRSACPTAIGQMATPIQQLLTPIRPTPNRQLPLAIARHHTL